MGGNTPASDFNLFSSKRSMKEFLSKRLGGTVEAPVRFARDVAAGGSIVSDDFRRGDFAGAGFGLYKDENGNAVCEGGHPEGPQGRRSSTRRSSTRSRSAPAPRSSRTAVAK